MLTTIRTDMNEFYSTVCDDMNEQISKSTVANNISNADISCDLKEFYGNMFSDTTHTVKKVQHTTKTALTKLDEKVMDEILVPWEYKDAVHEVEIRRNMEDVYTTPMLNDVITTTDAQEEEYSDYAFELQETEEFLTTFDVNDRTDDIEDILLNYPNSVKIHFQELVPIKVSYEEFWQRYFFRCDVDRIVRIWTYHDNLIKQKRKERVHNIKHKVTTPIRAVLTWQDTLAKIEVKCRQSIREVYTIPLLKTEADLDKALQRERDAYKAEVIRDYYDTKEFLLTFNVNDVTDDIENILEQHPETVKKYFEELVPVHVSFEDFWERYYFRCNTERIIRAWQFNTQRVRKIRNDNMKAWVQPVIAVSQPVKRVIIGITKIFSSIKDKEEENNIIVEEEEEYSDYYDEEDEMEITFIHQTTQPQSHYNDNQHNKVLSTKQDPPVVGVDKLAALRLRIKEAKERLAEAEHRAKSLKTDLVQFKHHNTPTTATVIKKNKTLCGDDSASSDTMSLDCSISSSVTCSTNSCDDDNGDMSSVAISIYSYGHRGYVSL